MPMPPLPTMVDTTATPATAMATDMDVDTMVDTMVDTPMADTDMLTTTASVPLMLSLRLMPRPIPHTCMLAITAMPATPTLTDIPMVPTTATAQLSLPATNTSPLLLPL